MLAMLFWVLAALAMVGALALVWELYLLVRRWRFDRSITKRGRILVWGLRFWKQTPCKADRPDADLHDAVNFALSRFSEIRIQQCGDFRCSTSLNATFDGT
jgi:hypothetical protein